MTFEQFEQFHDDGMKHEFLKGEHIVVPPAKSRHSRIQQKLQHALRPYVLEHRLGEVHIEAGFKLSTNTWLQPDVSFLRSDQIQVTDPDGYYEGAPAVAIEVASDSAAQLALKMDLYFAHGSEEAWVVYPKTRSIVQHSPDRKTTAVASAELTADIFPGWSVRIDALFTN